MAGGYRVLRRAALILSVVTATAFLFQPAPCFAAYSSDATQRVIAYGAQSAELGADLAAVKAWNKAIKAMNDQAAKIAAWKHTAYADDHRTAKSGLSYVKLTGSAYAEKFKGGGGYESNMPGYRAITAGGPTHAALYEQRVSSWRGRMKEILSGNNYALSDISSRQAQIKSIMDDARRAGGYTGRAEEAAYLEALLDDEMSKLNADVDRRLALDTETSLNEQLERSDALAAYSLAVGSWRAPSGGGGY